MQNYTFQAKIHTPSSGFSIAAIPKNSQTCTKLLPATFNSRTFVLPIPSVMKKLCLSSILLILVAATFAQKPTAESIRKRFSLGTTFFTDIWMDVPDSINPRAINQGVDVYTYYNFPMDRKGHMFFFAGAGIGAHNFYHNALIGTKNGVSYLYNVPDKDDNGNSISVKKSKLSITYFDVPFGFRYKAANKLHGTVGFKVGWSLNDHSKYKGTDLDGSGLTVKEKSAKLPNIENFHYGPFVSIGYKWFGLTASYQISPIFEKDLGPQIYPISVGVTFRPN